jgi:thiosulfate/3-mercaptopyruvate sulfurtransferase
MIGIVSRARPCRHGILAIGLILVTLIAVEMLMTPAKAGTEDGSFCPTCPDWSNLDGWMKQRDAYYSAENQAKTSDGSTSSIAEGGKKTDPLESANFPNGSSIAFAKNQSGIFIDARHSAEYELGHIPGARSIPSEVCRSGGALNTTALTSALQKEGINSSDAVIVYGNGDDASFLFWALKYLGHEDVRRLDGGIIAWKEAGQRLEKGSIVRATTKYRGSFNDDLLITPQELSEIAEEKASEDLIIDGRNSFADYGVDHLKGALRIPSRDLFRDDMPWLLKSPAELEELLGNRGINEKQRLIVYGTPEAYSTFWALVVMGYNASVIDGEWWRRSGLSVANIKEW